MQDKKIIAEMCAARDALRMARVAHVATVKRLKVSQDVERVASEKFAEASARYYAVSLRFVGLEA